MDMNRNNNYGRSREGAWIEIMPFMEMVTPKQVAPVRERGLKSFGFHFLHRLRRRSSEGAWIEIFDKCCQLTDSLSRSREGAWIEIRNTVGFSVLLTQMTYSD